MLSIVISFPFRFTCPQRYEAEKRRQLQRRSSHKIAGDIKTGGIYQKVADIFGFTRRITLTTSFSYCDQRCHLLIFAKPRKKNSYLSGANSRKLMMMVIIGVLGRVDFDGHSA